MLNGHTLLRTALVAGLALSQSNCTIIGAGIGELIDATTAQSLAPRQLAPQAIEPGREITLQLRDGRSLKGKYIGIVPLPAEEYAGRYQSARERHLPTAPLPELGDTVTLYMTGGGELNAEFIGFDPGVVSVRTLGSAQPESIQAQEVRQLQTGCGAAMTGEALRFLLSEGALPFQSALAVHLTAVGNPAGLEQRVPLDRVALIEWDSDKGRKVGTIVGGVIDAAVLVAVVVGCTATGCGSFSGVSF